MSNDSNPTDLISLMSGTREGEEAAEDEEIVVVCTKGGEDG